MEHCLDVLLFLHALIALLSTFLRLLATKYTVLLTRTLEQGPGPGLGCQGPGQGPGLKWQGPGPGPGLGCQGPGQGQGLESVITQNGK